MKTTCKENKLKEFHFKFIHRIIVTKKELCSFRVKDDDASIVVTLTLLIIRLSIVTSQRCFALCRSVSPAISLVYHRAECPLFSRHLLTVYEISQVCHIAHYYSNNHERYEFHWLHELALASAGNKGLLINLNKVDHRNNDHLGLLCSLLFINHTYNCQEKTSRVCC